MKQNMVKLRWLVSGLAVGGVIMLTASLHITRENTDRAAVAESITSQPSALAVPGARDSLNLTDLRSSATTTPNDQATPDSSMDAQGTAQARASALEANLPGHNIVKSSDPRKVRGQSEQTASGNLEIAVPVPPGEQAPVVFYDNEPRTEPQALIMDEIARDFNEAIRRDVPGYTAEEVWSEARDWADERYMLFFGEEDWNKLHLQAALDALREKEAMGQISQRSYE
jgi:hypothetical protein